MSPTTEIRRIKSNSQANFNQSEYKLVARQTQDSNTTFWT